jgi:hypothetical protein
MRRSIGTCADQIDVQHSYLAGEMISPRSADRAAGCAGSQTSGIDPGFAHGIHDDRAADGAHITAHMHPLASPILPDMGGQFTAIIGQSRGDLVWDHSSATDCRLDRSPGTSRLQSGTQCQGFSSF